MEAASEVAAKVQKFTIWLGGRDAPAALPVMLQDVAKLGIPLEVQNKGFEQGGYALVKLRSKEQAWQSWDTFKAMGVYMGRWKGPQVDAWLVFFWFHFLTHILVSFPFEEWQGRKLILMRSKADDAVVSTAADNVEPEARVRPAEEAVDKVEPEKKGSVAPEEVVMGDKGPASDIAETQADSQPALRRMQQHIDDKSTEEEEHKMKKQRRHEDLTNFKQKLRDLGAHLKAAVECYNDLEKKYNLSDRHSRFT